MGTEMIAFLDCRDSSSNSRSSSSGSGSIEVYKAAEAGISRVVKILAQQTQTLNSINLDPKPPNPKPGTLHHVFFILHTNSEP